MASRRSTRQAARRIIVWEYKLDVGQFFGPYASPVSNFLEEKYEAGQDTASLQQIDATLSNYDVCFSPPMFQKSKATGFRREVRRMVYDADSEVMDSIVWEWLSEIGWTVYNYEIACLIEDGYQRGQDQFDLESTVLCLPNIIHYKKGYQQNKRTLFVRYIQRRSLLVLYKTEAEQDSTTHRSNYEIKDILLKKYCSLSTNIPDEKCPICFGQLPEIATIRTDDSDDSPSEVIQFKECEHQFHEECLEATMKYSSQKSGIKCPCCGKIYGVRTGNQPQGTMRVRSEESSLDGYPDCGTIVIIYDFKPGIQGPGHPNPGERYYARGFPRYAYLPENKEGRKILKLLRKAWERNLVFTISRSVTSGCDNAVVWNDIHHKTERYGNHNGHGFPDQNFFSNVKFELKAQGIEESDESSDDED